MTWTPTTQKAVKEALKECLEWMESLRASGDAGFWDWKDDEYTRGLHALELIRQEEEK